MKNQSDYKRALAKLKAARIDAMNEGRLTISQLLKEGVLKAKTAAPYATGLTAKSVRSVQRERSDGSNGIIIAPNAHKSEFKTRQYPFNLTEWMHNPKNFGHFNKARPDFMNLTRDYLNKITKGVAENNFKRITIKYGR